MDPLSTGASALAFISVAIQVADTCRKLYDFWKSVEGAPGDVALILDDLQHLSSVLDDIAGKKMSLSPSVVAGLRCCQTRMEELKCIAKALEKDLQSTSRKTRLWTSFKAPVRLQKLQKFQESLNYLKTTLTLALMYQSIRQTDKNTNVTDTDAVDERPPPYTASEQPPYKTFASENTAKTQSESSFFERNRAALIRAKYSGSSKDSALVANNVVKSILKISVEQAFEELIDSKTIEQLMSRAIGQTTTFESRSAGDYGPDGIKEKPQVSEDILKNGSDTKEVNVVHQTAKPSRPQICHRVSSYGFAFGSFWSRTSTVQLEAQLSKPKGCYQSVTSFIFYPASWLNKLGMKEGLEVKILDGWQLKFEPIRAVPESSPIFDLCQEGEVRAVELLIEKGHASVLDTSPKGWTPLHFAAAAGHVELCASLIRLGANRAALAYEGPSLNALSPIALFATLARNLPSAKKIEMLRLFVDYLDISEPNGDGWTVHSELKRTYNSEDVPVLQNSITWLLRTTADEPYVSFGPKTIWTAVQHAVRSFVVHEQHDQILHRLLGLADGSPSSISPSHAAAFAHWFALRASERELLPMVLNGGRFCQIQGFDWIEDDIKPGQFLKALPVIYAAWAVALPNGIERVEEFIKLELNICLEQLGWTRESFIQLLLSTPCKNSLELPDNLNLQACSVCGDVYDKNGHGLVQPIWIRRSECLKTNHRWSCNCLTFFNKSGFTNSAEERHDSQGAEDSESEVDEEFFDAEVEFSIGNYDVEDTSDSCPDPFLDAALMLYRAQGRNWIGQYGAEERLCATCFLRREKYIGEDGVGTELDWPPLPPNYEMFRADVKDCTVEGYSN